MLGQLHLICKFLTNLCELHYYYFYVGFWENLYTSVFSLIGSNGLEDIIVKLQTKWCICLSDLPMTEVVEFFVVGHWAVFHKKLTERHVSRNMKNLVDVEMRVTGQRKDL